MMKDYYQTLGVGRDATPDEIKNAFRRLARETHPDANPDDPSAEARFREIAEAYRIGDRRRQAPSPAHIAYVRSRAVVPILIRAMIWSDSWSEVERIAFALAGITGQKPVIRRARKSVNSPPST